MKPSLPASCWPALTRDLARTGAAGVPSGASTTASYSQLDGRSTASVIEPSILGFMSTEVVHGQPVLM